MWPLDAGRDACARIGSAAAELWEESRDGLVLLASEAYAGRCSLYDPDGIVEPIRSLLSRHGSGRVSLVAESCFIPCVLVDTGRNLWRQDQVDNLIRLRLGQTFGGPGSNIASWEVRARYAFGERHALGFALPPQVKAAFASASESTHCKPSLWTSSLAWAIDRYRPWRSQRHGHGWWMWPEMDRTLMLRFDAGKVTQLNPAGPILKSGDDVDQAVQSERIRCGIPANLNEFVELGEWTSKKSSSTGVANESSLTGTASA